MIIVSANKTGTAGRFVELQLYIRYQGEAATSKNIILSGANVALNTGVNDVANAVRLSFNSDVTGDTPRIFGNTKDYGFAYTDSYVYYQNPTSFTAFNGLGDISMLDGSENLNTTVTNYEYVHTIAEALADEKVLFTLPANSTQIITIRIYVEGWANATTDAIIASSFDFSFDFAFAS